MSEWAIVYVMPNHERLFMTTLAGFDASYFDCCYAPMSKRIIRPRHKRKAVLQIRPAFPGYVFLRLVDSLIYYYAGQVSSYLYTIKHEEELCILTDDAINSLKERELRGEFDLITTLQRIKDLLGIGVQIRIEQGIFAGYDGVILNMLSGGRAKILVQGRVVTLPLVCDGEIMYSPLLASDPVARR